LPLSDSGGYGNRRFSIIRRAAWITLYRAVGPSPHIGVHLRCTGLAGEALFTLADRQRHEIEPRLVAELGPGVTIRWNGSEHPSMAHLNGIITAFIASPFPWNETAAGRQIEWLLRTGSIWWTTFAALAKDDSEA
jgi:hypothetical protein